MNIARIDLKNKTFKLEEIPRSSKYFLLGGRALSSQIIHDEIPPECDPLGVENKLIFATGLLTGSPFPNSARSSVGAKSPLTNGAKEANVGGRPSMAMASHGIQAIVLESCAIDLSLIILDDNGITFESAREYATMGNYELHNKLQQKFGNRISIYSIGPAGEFLMKSASVAANDLEGYPSRHAARGGLGAVMGSKKVKAIIIRPTRTSKIKIHDLKKLREISTPFAKSLAKSKEAFSIMGTAYGMKAMSQYGGLPTMNFRKGSYEAVDNISGEKLHEITIARGGKKRIPCSPTCVIKCSNYLPDTNGKYLTSSFEYETIALCGSNLGMKNLDDVAKIDYLCDDIGIDTIEFGVTIGVAMDNQKIAWGDAKKVFEILEEIRKNSKIGQLCGNGVCHFGFLINAKRIPQVKGQGISGYDPRVFKGMGVTYSTTPMGADHTAGAAIYGRAANKNKDYGDYNIDKGKLDLSYELQVYTTVLDSMGCCYFIGPNYENMELLALAFNAMHGTNLIAKNLIELGKNTLRMELEFNEEAGITQDSNTVPDFFREEASEPSGLKFTFSKIKLKNFWKRLDET